VPRLDALKHGWFDFRRKRFWAWLLLALYTLFGFVIAPLIVRNVIVSEVHSLLGLTATLDDVDINPYALTVRLEKFSLANPKGAPLVAFDEVDINAQLSSIWNRALTLRELRIVHPFMRVERDAESRLNLTALVPPEDPNATPEPESPPPRLIIASAVIEGGRVAVSDHSGRQPYKTELGPLDVHVSDLNTLPNRQGSQRIVVQTRAGGRLEWTGTMTVRPFAASGHVSLTGQRLPEMSAYLPADLMAAIVDGSLDAAFDYTVSIHDGATAAELANLKLALKNLGIAQPSGGNVDAAPAQDLVRLGEFVVEGGRIAWPQRSVSVRRVALVKPEFHLSRDAQQRFVWETLWRSNAAPTADAPATAPDTAAANQPVAEAAAPAAPAAPSWSVDVARIDVSDGALKFADLGVNPPAHLGLAALNVSLDTFSLADNAVMPFSAHFDVDGGGSIAVDGTLTALPEVRVDATAKIDALGLSIANPYLGLTTYLQLKSGALGIDGHVVSNPQELFGFDGRLQLTELDVGREGADDHFLGLKRFDLNGLTVSMAQHRVDIARGELVGAFARIHISKDRVLNLSELTRPAPEEPPIAVAPAATTESVSAEPSWGFKMARLKVVDADVDFADESLPIPFQRSISALSGNIGIFDTASRSPTQITLEGQVGEFGQLKVSGALRALDPTQNTDITAQFVNIDMPGASPYVIRFAGHEVASGKLDLKLHYVLRDGILDGDHKIVLRDFALGEKVPYPDALDLPYGLAISLLKDSSGNIDIDLPVEGDVNDPTFRIGGVVMKALANLITSIATAPFRLLGRLVGLGDSDDFDRIYFTAGRADLAPPEREKVAKLADALVLRPNLALTLHGVANAEADGRALREAALRTRLDARVGDEDAEGRLRIVESMAKESVPGLDPAALRAQFTVPPAPGAAIAFDETAYLKALVQKLVDVEPLPANAVDDLAAQRAATVREGLAANASFDAARITDGGIQEVKPAKDDTLPMKLELTAH
jgi:uncharacterized protein involved in outer membrane biogenesis